MAGKIATYWRKDSRCDLIVVPVEDAAEMVSFNGFSRYRDSRTFLVTLDDVRPDGKPVEPKDGDVIAHLSGEDLAEYEITVDSDGKFFEPFGMNKVGMILHTRKMKS